MQGQGHCVVTPGDALGSAVDVEVHGSAHVEVRAGDCAALRVVAHAVPQTSMAVWASTLAHSTISLMKM